MYQEFTRVSFGWVSTFFFFAFLKQVSNQYKESYHNPQNKSSNTAMCGNKKFPFNTLSLPIDLECAASLHSVCTSTNGCTHGLVLTIDLFCDRQLPLPTFLDDFQGLLLRFLGLWFKASWVSFRS